MPTVAVIGASADRHKYGNKAVRAYLRQGWTVYPVHPSAAQIEGLLAYRSLRVPAPLDRVSLYLPPDTGLSILDDLAAVPHAEFYVNPGAEPRAHCARRGPRPAAHQACSIVEIGVSPSSL